MHGRSVLMHTVYLIELIISKGEKALPTSWGFVRMSLFVSSPVAFTIWILGIGVTPISSFFSRCWYFCPSKNKWLKSSGEEMNWTDHQVFGCCPVLPRGIHERNPLSPSFYGFWSWIVKKWNCMDRIAFFLIFRVTTAIHNTLLYHFFTYN